MIVAGMKTRSLPTPPLRWGQTIFHYLIETVSFSLLILVLVEEWWWWGGGRGKMSFRFFFHFETL